MIGSGTGCYNVSTSTTRTWCTTQCSGSPMLSPAGTTSNMERMPSPSYNLSSCCYPHTPPHSTRSSTWRTTLFGARSSSNPWSSTRTPSSTIPPMLMFKGYMGYSTSRSRSYCTTHNQSMEWVGSEGTSWWYPLPHQYRPYRSKYHTDPQIVDWLTTFGLVGNRISEIYPAAWIVPVCR